MEVIKSKTVTVNKSKEHISVTIGFFRRKILSQQNPEFAEPNLNSNAPFNLFSLCFAPCNLVFFPLFCAFELYSLQNDLMLIKVLYELHESLI